MRSPRNNWLLRWGEERAHTDVRLVCFPHAGAGPNVYRTWRHHLPDRIALYAVCLPGRGNRMGEQPLTNIVAMARELAPVVRELVEPPMVFFGHSMGAVLGYEVARSFHAAGRADPSLLAVSGRTAPHLLSREPKTHHLPRDEFVETLLKAGGTAPEVLADEDLLNLVLPTVRADLEAVDTYRLEPGEALACPVLALGGRADAAVDEQELGGWRQHTTGSFTLRMFPGGHFFLQEDEKGVTAELAVAMLRAGVV
jgi:medium-chain acyl-[acyl-carrier-protein] hydrolase